MAEDQVNGIVHWAAVEFAEMSSYKPKLINESVGAFASVNDVSNNNVFKDFARWLKDDPRWFPKTGE